MGYECTANPKHRRENSAKPDQDLQKTNHTKNTPLARVMKANLFDTDALAGFVDNFGDGNLWN